MPYSTQYADSEEFPSSLEVVFRVRAAEWSLVGEFGALGPSSIAERLVAWEVVFNAGSLQLPPPLALPGHQPLHTLLLLIPRALPIYGLHFFDGGGTVNLRQHTGYLNIK